MGGKERALVRSGTQRRGRDPPGRGHGVSSGHSQAPARGTKRNGQRRTYRGGHRQRRIAHSCAVGLNARGGEGGRATVFSQLRFHTGLFLPRASQRACCFASDVHNFTSVCLHQPAFFLRVTTPLLFTRGVVAARGDSVGEGLIFL